MMKLVPAPNSQPKLDAFWFVEEINHTKSLTGFAFVSESARVRHPSYLSRRLGFDFPKVPAPREPPRPRSTSAKVLCHHGRARNGALRGAGVNDQRLCRRNLVYSLPVRAAGFGPSGSHLCWLVLGLIQCTKRLLFSKHSLIKESVRG
jgi:hypothetical protein